MFSDFQTMTSFIDEILSISSWSSSSILEFKQLFSHHFTPCLFIVWNRHGNNASPFFISLFLYLSFCLNILYFSSSSLIFSFFQILDFRDYLRIYFLDCWISDIQYVKWKYFEKKSWAFLIFFFSRFFCLRCSSFFTMTPWCK